MILYSLIACGNLVLCDTDSPSKSAKELTRQIISKLNDEETTNDSTRISFVHDSYLFHVIRVGKLVFLCIATEDFGRRRCFAFLEDIRARFTQLHGQEALRTKKKYKFDNVFGGTLGKQMDYYSRSNEADAIGALKANVEEAKLIIGTNVSHIIKVGESISEVVQKAQDLEVSSKEVRDQAKAIKNHYWWANAKYYIAIFCICFGFAFYIASKACGGITFPDCKSAPEDDYDQQYVEHQSHRQYTPPPKPHTATTATGGKKHKYDDDVKMALIAAQPNNFQSFLNKE